MENLVEIYDEVLVFMKNIKNLIPDIPDFEEKEGCEDCLFDAMHLCSDWLELNNERYLEAKRKEEIALNVEYERMKL